eukprot:TRINITY_DN35909_c4_g1_i1.p1 TRINITY_DN35909_c4_g1~~TRINITY_DN35909_c4_g1_i1.p1  ORF type:complete len:86 (+),score=0.53 TRINITY_DN35909_c4_g1_i1:144-401(+)
MDEKFSSAFNNLSKQSKGVVCCDINGLCLKSSGAGNSESAGYIQAIMSRSKTLSDSGISPTISIECNKSKILISESSDITLAVYK